MISKQPKNPLHGVTLEQVVTRLVEHYGWEVKLFCQKSSAKNLPLLEFTRIIQVQ